MRIKNENNAVIGGRIKKIRTDRNITQEALAEMAELGSAQQISDIERGLCGISVARLADFCRVLNVDADYLLFGTVTKNIDNPLNKYLSKMTPQQARGAEEIIAAYAKACGIE